VKASRPIANARLRIFLFMGHFFTTHSWTARRKLRNEPVACAMGKEEAEAGLVATPESNRNF